MNAKRSFIIGIESFFSTWALNRAFRLGPGNLLSVLIFAGCFLFYKYVIGLYMSADSSDSEAAAGSAGLMGAESVARSVGLKGTAVRRSLVCSRVFGLLFTLFYFLYDRDNYVEDLTNRGFRAIMLSAILVGFYFLFVHALRFIYFYFGDASFTDSLFFRTPGDTDPNIDIQDADSDEMSSEEKGEKRAGWFVIICKNYKKHMGAWTFVLCLIFFLPYFLYQFPGIMTPDSIVQYEQILHIHPYSNHHPWIHTLTLGLFYDLGYAFTRNPNISVSFYTVVQMIFMAWCASFVVKTLQIRGFRPLVCFIATLFYALVPYNDVFAVTIWKDIPFAGVVAVFVCILIRLDAVLEQCDQIDKTDNIGSNDSDAVKEDSDIEKNVAIRLIVGMAVLGMGICLLRSNGWYAFIVLTPFLMIHFWKRSKKAMIAVAVSLILAAVVRYPLMNAFHVEQPDFVESLSIPVQQVASVIVNGGEVDQDSLYEIQKVVDLTYIDKLYEPTFADNIKELVRAGDQQYLIDNKLVFFKIYLKLGVRNPAEYLKAFVMQTYGYFYPDREYDVANAEGVVSSRLEFHTTPLIGGPVVIKAKEIFIKLGNMIPLYSVLWCMGAMFWILLTGMSVLIVRGERDKVIYYLPYLLLVLTVLVATPVATEFRYVYFLMYSIPLIFTIFSFHNDII